MKKIAITQRVDEFHDRGETRDALDQRLNMFVRCAEFLPFPIPNDVSNKKTKPQSHVYFLTDWIKCVEPDAFILSGGGNLGENCARDNTEQWILKYASENNLPVFGICRGVQAMAKYEGVEIHEVKNHVAKSHKISGVISGVVNSFHNYSINHCPNGFEVLAKSDDGEIEAIGNSKKFWEGWMWHPERADDFERGHIRRFSRLVNKDL